MKYIQSGRNDKYPNEIITWKYGEKVPDWLSDICKIKFIDGEGNITLETRQINNTGLEFISSDGIGSIIKLKNKSEYICYDKERKRLFALSPIQLSLLYKEVTTALG